MKKRITERKARVECKDHEGEKKVRRQVNRREKERENMVREGILIMQTKTSREIMMEVRN